MRQTQHRQKIMYIVTMGLLSAILLIGQLGMAFLPNIEPVSFLIIAYTLVYKKRVFPIIYAFVILEGLIFGFGIWWVSYLYIWSILALLVLLLQKTDSAILWAVIAGAYGLAFGALCSIPYLISGGPGAALTYWAAGIPYDILHCAGNFVITLVLYHPVLHVLKKLHASQLEKLPVRNPRQTWKQSNRKTKNNLSETQR